MNRLGAVLAIDKLMVDGEQSGTDDLRLRLALVERDTLAAALYRRLRARGVEALAARIQASALSAECLFASGCGDTVDRQVVAA